MAPAEDEGNIQRSLYILNTKNVQYATLIETFVITSMDGTRKNKSKGNNIQKIAYLYMKE